MLSFRATTEFCESRCASAGSVDPGGVTECSQGCSPAQPLVSGVSESSKPRQGRRKLPPRPTPVVAQAPTCNGKPKTVQ